MIKTAWDDTKQAWNGSNPVESLIAASDWNSMVTDQKARLSDITGEAISSLSDVSTSSLADNDIFAYDATSSTWTNQSASEAGVATSDHVHAEYAASSDLVSSTSELINDSGFITSASLPTSTSELTNDSGFITSASLPTSTSELTNDSGFITSASLPTSTSELTNDSGFITSASLPSSTSELTNDSGFIYSSDVTYETLNSNSDVGTTAGTLAAGDDSRFLSTAQKTDLTDGGDSSAHYHSGDRNRANHTGTQTAATISDFDTEVSNNTDVAANTSARHTAVTVSGTPDYITLSGQDLVRGQVDLTTDVTGYLPVGNIVTSTAASSTTFLRGDGSWATPAGSGDVSKVGTPSDNQVGVWTGDGTIEGTSGLTYNGTAFAVTGDITVTGTVDSVDIGALAGSVTTNNAKISFDSTSSSKLAGIEAGADVTDATNVEAAGALMDSEVDSDIKTLSLPANTTISTFGASLVDDVDAATARSTLDVDQAGTDNSTNVTLAGTGTYLSLTGQQITVDPITESDITDLGSYLENVSEDTSPQLGGDLDCNDKHITLAETISFEAEYDNSSKTANFTVDFINGQKQKVTLTANTMTLTLDTTSVGVGNYLLKIVNGGLATLTWASESGSVYWSGGTAPTLTSSGTDIVTFYFDGTNWYGVANLDFS